MTSEYEPGAEDIGVLAYARPDGFVGLALHFLEEDGSAGLRIAGAVLHPETARNIAKNLTLSSFKAEDITKWRDEQRD